jgi:hypothetical protein
LEELLDALLVFLIAGTLTWFDLDETFYIPRAATQKFRLGCYWWGFVIANGALASFLYGALQEQELFKGMNHWARAAAVGFGYLALVRFKFTTVQNVPIGFEAFYEKFKRSVYRRINLIVVEARQTETQEMVSQYELPELVKRAKLRIHNDALLTDEQKSKSLAWVLQVIRDTQNDDFDKSVTIAIFILAGSTGGGAPSR